MHGHMNVKNFYKLSTISEVNSQPQSLKAG